MQKDILKDYIWAEKYRPKTIEDCILPDNTKKLFNSMISSKNIPHMTLYGPPGIGKTTIGLVLSDELCADIIVLNGSGSDRGIDTIRTKIPRFATTIGEGNFKIVLIDEADNLTHDAQLALRGVIEEFSKNCRFILTCNNKNGIQDAILSRCQPIDISVLRKDKNKIFKRCVNVFSKIMNKEIGGGIDRDYVIENIVPIVNKFFPDYRKINNNLQLLFNGTPIEKILSESNNDIENLLDIMKSSDSRWVKTRQWVANDMGDMRSLVNYLFENGASIFMEDDLAQLGLYLEEYQDKLSRSSNPDITAMAMLTMIMAKIKFIR